MTESFGTRVIRLIRAIPRGKVATYGQVAALAGSPRAAIIVGQILRYQTERSQLPWQRVVGKGGRITIVNMEFPAVIQAELLRQEGVEVTENNGQFVADLTSSLWLGPGENSN